MINLQISSLLQQYKDNELTPERVIDYTCNEIDKSPDEVWIYKLSKSEIDSYLSALDGHSPETKPLYGIPFVIKDNIDLSGVPTTAGCPDYRYTPKKSAYVVERLIQAGAIPLGKTNLDQFATGLVGTRSPYGACPNSFDPEYISGGSSSGSAVAVAAGYCSFSLGTDTAGSGRVPAAFNNLIGLKPTKGLLSNTGVVPACRSLDCVSIFAMDTADAKRVLDVAADYDRDDSYSKRITQKPPANNEWTFGVPEDSQLEFFGNTLYKEAFERSVKLLETCGGKKVIIDFKPFIDAAQLLYSGPWVNERYAAVGEFIENNPASALDTTKNIITSGLDIPAPDVFTAMYSLQDCKRLTDAAMDSVDVLLTPTAGSCYTINEVNNDPVQLNTNLGYYTNYMNLLDYSAIAVPTEITPLLPFGVTLVSHAGSDNKLLDIAGRIQTTSGLTTGLSGNKPLAYNAEPTDTVDIAVCGAHLKGYPLHYQLEELGATFVESTYTAAEYAMYALEDGKVAKPGLIHTENGVNVYIEVYRLSYESFGKFVSMIPAPLGIGKLNLSEGKPVCGFIAEAEVAQLGKNISDIADWREYKVSN